MTRTNDYSEKGILLVHKVEDILFAYKNYLKKKGFKNIYTVQKVQECKKILAQNLDKISVLVLDWVGNNNEENQEILDFLKGQTKQFSVILMSTRNHVPIEIYEKYNEILKIDETEIFTVKDCRLIYEEIGTVLNLEKKNSCKSMLLNQAQQEKKLLFHPAKSEQNQGCEKIITLSV